VVSRTGVEEGSGRGRLSLFIVDTDAPGLDRAPIELQVNAPERQFFLFLDDVRVDGDRLLGDEGDGLRHLGVVHRVLDAIGQRGIGLADVEPQVEDQSLAHLALGLPHPVMGVERQPGHLHGDEGLGRLAGVVELVA
jgi:hypothetical protein